MMGRVTGAEKRAILQKAVNQGGECMITRHARVAYALRDDGLGDVSFDDIGFMDFTINDDGRHYLAAWGGR
ncbi:MAG: hypothetical protein JKY47_02350 [Thalassospira sp.]|nr:hypothetical protein [Thalassospira sp.]